MAPNWPTQERNIQRIRSALTSDVGKSEAVS